MGREFLQAAKTYNPGKSKVSGWYVSEKLDGTRCFWDGGLTRGMRTEEVPWANITDPKTGERKKKIKPIATGLWSRYGNPIIAPDNFLDQLPPCPLDGELWAGRGKFQLCRSICSGDLPDPRFDLIQYAVYGTPPIMSVLQSGEITLSSMVMTFDEELLAEYVNFLVCQNNPMFQTLERGSTFEHELLALARLTGDRVYLHPQMKLSENESEAREQVEAEFEKVLDRRGEGVVIRNPNAVWAPKRVPALLKYKPCDDDEGVIVGFTSGRETDKGSKLLGMIGALILDYNGKRLELSGLTNEEREFENRSRSAFATANPGKDMPAEFQGKHFKVGQKVTFKYRELSDDGIPKDARYMRIRDEE